MKDENKPKTTKLKMEAQPVRLDTSQLGGQSETHLYSICNFCFAFIEPRVRYFYFDEKDKLLYFIEEVCETNWLTQYQANMINACEHPILCQQCFAWYQRYSEVIARQALKCIPSDIFSGIITHPKACASFKEEHVQGHTSDCDRR